MKTLLVGRIKKWTVLALIGCSAYFVGYVWGFRAMKAPAVTSVAGIRSAR